MLRWSLSLFLRGKIQKRSQPPGGGENTAAFALGHSGFYALLGAALSYFATTSTWNTAQPILGTCWMCSGIGNDQVGYVQCVQDAHSRLQAKGNSLIRPSRVLSHAGREKGKLERILALHGNVGKKKKKSLPFKSFHSSTSQLLFHISAAALAQMLLSVRFLMTEHQCVLYWCVLHSRF